MQDSSTNWRSLVLEALDLIGSRDEQLQYEHAVPNVDITSELVSIWFDQVYHPDHDQFSSAFSVKELGSLNEFNQVFDQAVDALPDSQGTVETWLDNNLWQRVMQAAEQARRQIDSAQVLERTCTIPYEQSRVPSPAPDSI
jgi:hypothetical protein